MTEDVASVLCLRLLKGVELGQDFNLWVFNFYNEMVEKQLHQYFPYDEESKKLSELIIKILVPTKEAASVSTGTAGSAKQAPAIDGRADDAAASEAEEDKKVLARSYLIRFLAPSNTRSLSAIALSQSCSCS